MYILTHTDTQTCVRLTAPPDEVYFNVEPYSRTTVPGSRYGHTVCAYKHRMYMYGGRNDEDGSFSKVDCYDIRKTCIVLVHKCLVACQESHIVLGLNVIMYTCMFSPCMARVQNTMGKTILFEGA